MPPSATTGRKSAEASTHPRPLKRTNSCASVTSLPTPPRTRKRKRSHSRATDSDESDPEDHAVPLVDSDDEEIKCSKLVEARGTLFLGNKKRKMLQVDAIAAELSGTAAEDAFWGGPSTTTISESKTPQMDAKENKKREDTEPSRGRSRSRSPSSSPAQHLLKRTHTGLLSPPRSRRHKSPVGALLIRPAPPVTPPRHTGPITRSVQRRLFPERDSPNNPFLLDPEATPEHTTRSSGSLPRTPIRHVERPKITYVFRGVRAEFDNPLYDPRYPETGLPPPDPKSPSNLSVTDPNFSPTPYCPPKLLFPEAHRRHTRAHANKNTEPSSKDKSKQSKGEDEPTAVKGKGKARDLGPASRTRRAVRSEWDTSDEEDEGDAVQLELLGGDTQKVQSSQPLLKDGVRRKLEFRTVSRGGAARPRSSQKDRSDPVKRALGPVRKGAARKTRQ